METSHSAGSQCEPWRWPVGESLVAHIAGRGRAAIGAHGIVSGPARIAGYAAFVAHPADVRTHVAEDHRVGLQLAHQLPGARPVVVSVLVDEPLLARAAIKTVAAVGAVVPHLEDGTVAGEQFAKLPPVDFDVLRATVVSAVAVPRRKVDAESDAVAPGGFRDIAHHVAVAAAPRARTNRVFRGGGGPQAETVMMLGGEDDAFHAGLRQRFHDRVRVESRGGEKVWILVAVAPLLAGERIHGEMQKRGGFELMPAELPRGRNGAIGSGDGGAERANRDAG